MASAFETRLGELAIARGLVSLDDLLQCIQQSHGSGASLCDAIVDRGLASRDEIDGLCRELDERSHEELAPEFEAGETAALESFEIPSTDTAVAQVEQADTLDRPNSSTGSAPTFQLGESPEDAPTDDELSIANFPERDERYEIESELGAGGMGRVLLARDRVMNREIALKAVRRDLGSRENARKRLIHEARLTGLLEHPSIVPTYELARTPNGEPFYTMRVVREKSLEQILDEIREEDPTDADNPPTRLVSFLRQVALALHYAHDRQVIHRDIKPANILIGAYGEVFIIDWGVAKVLSEDLTSYSLDALLDLDEGAILGTPWYMAPEQAEGSDQQIDRRTDVYSLGAVLYEILTLTPVFRTEKTVSLVFKVLTEAPEPPSERAPDRAIPRELEQICMKALAKNPDERFDSA
ncbi:MAG: serine/threonine-protein kinase, partial [Bradymonadaceae bacterium]